MEMYEAHNASAQKCHKRNRESKYSDLNKALHAWFCLAVFKNVYPDGRILKELKLLDALIVINLRHPADGLIVGKKTLQCQADESKR